MVVGFASFVIVNEKIVDEKQTIKVDTGDVINLGEYLSYDSTITNEIKYTDNLVQPGFIDSTGKISFVAYVNYKLTFVS